jgi:tRNA threonylcarbamoyladenosine biosynthesis protein TsaB
MVPIRNVLAVETSTDALSVALAVDTARFERRFTDPVPHSERILVVVDALLREAGLRVSDLQGVAFGAGPGAFTGVRLGCGVAQGLAFACALPVVPVSSLQALALRTALSEADARRFVVATDARLGEVYYAAWSIETGAWRAMVPDCLADPRAVPVPSGVGWIGAGSGFVAHRAALEARLGAVLCAIRPQLVPDARAVVEIAIDELLAGRGVAPEHALPVYLRDKVALTTAERAAKERAQ